MASDVTGSVIARPKSLVRVVLGSATGTMIEWYDFYIFGSLTSVLAVKFYPPGNDTFALIAYLATFAIGFLVRPFGALFFGCVGDLVGRRIAFIFTLSIMGGATAAIGLLHYGEALADVALGVEAVRELARVREQLRLRRLRHLGVRRRGNGRCGDSDPRQGEEKTWSHRSGFLRASS